MESLGLIDSFSKAYLNTNVFLTGHTGFKGSWLSLWLSKLGAHVKGYSHNIPTSPSHYELLNLQDNISPVFADVRDIDKLKSEIQVFSPEIVFHLAAQPLVRYSYSNPLETFNTNIIGTVNLLEACKTCSSVKAVVIVTSDKCYENKNIDIGYSENDPLGGYDPYSASKACAELITSSYRSSYFSSKNKTSSNILLASVRAGNVIGGGDWSDDRLIPDLVKAFAQNKIVQIRYPNAVRPWQHVLESLSGYLSIGMHLLNSDSKYAQAWNFGPNQDDALKVGEIVKKITDSWPNSAYEFINDSNSLHEAKLLKLNNNKAKDELGWIPVWTVNKALDLTKLWYEEFLSSSKIISSDQIDQYVNDAKLAGMNWVD